jgi:riboflavin synthase
LHQILTLQPAVTALEPLDTSSSGGGGTSLTISDCEEILTDAHLGDSIAVNGISTL